MHGNKWLYKNTVVIKQHWGAGEGHACHLQADPFSDRGLAYYYKMLVMLSHSVAYLVASVMFMSA